jgi:hypothetical protein
MKYLITENQFDKIKEFGLNNLENYISSLEVDYKYSTEGHQIQNIVGYENNNGNLQGIFLIDCKQEDKCRLILHRKIETEYSSLYGLNLEDLKNFFSKMFDINISDISMPETY